jgi:hypothetical protein
VGGKLIAKTKMSPSNLKEAWVLHHCGDKMSAQDKTVKISINQILIMVCAIVFIVSSIVSTVFIVMSTSAIGDVSKAAESTALMCAERLVNEAETKEERKTTINTLQRENLFLRGKLETFEKLYGLSKGSYEEGVGGND